MNKKIEILLSTYNGSNYLSELLTSIINQSYSNVTIRIRDDGSSDNTKEIIEDFHNKYPSTHIDYGENIGPSFSFYTLLETSGDSDYFAFCDQDDLWESKKIENAVRHLNALDRKEPAMYFSRLEFVDSVLKHIGYTPAPKRIGFGNALVQNIAPGCIIVINRAARDLIITKHPKQLLMHDAWVYLVVSAFGKIIYDNDSQLKYRLHETNTIGAKHGFLKVQAGRLARFLNRENYFLYHEQALEFSRLYGDLISNENKSTLDLFINGKYNFISRINLLRSNDIWKQRSLDNIYLRSLILSNKY